MRELMWIQSYLPDLVKQVSFKPDCYVVFRDNAYFQINLIRSENQEDFIPINHEWH